MRDSKDKSSAPELPPGYVELSGIAVHMATLRRFTKDPKRFLRLAPLADRLMAPEPGSAEARAIYCDAEQAGDLDALIDTMREYAELESTLADEIQAGAPEQGPPSFVKRET